MRAGLFPLEDTMSKAYVEDRSLRPGRHAKPKKAARLTPPDNAPLMTEEVFFEENPERSPTWGVHQQEEQN